MFDENGNDAEFSCRSDIGKNLEEVSSDSAIMRPNLPNLNVETGSSASLWAHYKFIVLLRPVRVAIVGEESPQHSQFPVEGSMSSLICGNDFD